MSVSTPFERAKPALNWLETRVLTVFGQGSPTEQMATSFFLLVVFWAASFVTLGLTVFAALVFTFTFWWGVYRYVRGR